MNSKENDTDIVIKAREFEQIRSLLGQVRNNFHSVRSSWMDLQSNLHNFCNVESLNRNDVIVKKFSLQNIASESDKLKSLLLSILSQNEEMTVTKISSLEQELSQVKSESNEFHAEMIHWKSQLDSAVTDIQKEKQEQLVLRSELKELTEKLSEQSEFCCSLGAACCTLLWRISRQESSIDTLVSGCKTSEFMELVSVSVQGYLTAYSLNDAWPSPNTDEAMFILSICGIITNLAASAQGREYLASSKAGFDVIDTFIIFIDKAPNGKSAQIKSLMLMSLYNFSINCKGIKYLSSKRDLIPLLAKHLKEEKDTENQLRTLKLLQSLVSDETCASVCISELLDNLPKNYLEQFNRSCNKDIQNVSQELLSDMIAYRSGH